MMNNKKIILLLVQLFLFTLPAYAATEMDKYRHRFYLGVTGGYGTTTWEHLVAEDPNAATSLSTPLRVNEGGAVFGANVGYEFLPQFALEGSYMHYPSADLYFDPLSLFTFFHEDRTELTTYTDSLSVVGKLMLIIPHTCGTRFYSSAGLAGVHRNDAILSRWRVGPTFGVGFNYLINEHLMAEVGTEYIAGYGQSEIDPADHFVPFLISGFVRLAYRF